jgi:hypothetical protein
VCTMSRWVFVRSSHQLVAPGGVSFSHVCLVSVGSLRPVLLVGYDIANIANHYHKENIANIATGPGFGFLS